MLSFFVTGSNRNWPKIFCVQVGKLYISGMFFTSCVVYAACVRVGHPFRDQYAKAARALVFSLWLKIFHDSRINFRKEMAGTVL